MDIEGQRASGELRDPYRIERARHRLPASGFLYRAQGLAARSGMAERAFAAAFHQRGHDVPVPVYLEEARRFGGSAAALAHQSAEPRVIPLYHLRFVLLHGGAAIADYAAGAAADFIVAGEIFRHDILRHEDVAYLYNSAEFPFHHQMITYSTSAPCCSMDRTPLISSAVSSSTARLKLVTRSLPSL